MIVWRSFLCLLINVENLQLFVQALKQTGLWQILQEDGPFTVFAPIDQALQDLGESPLEKMHQNQLNQLLSHHVVPGRWFSSDLVNCETLKTIHAKELKLNLENGKIKLGQSRLLFKNIESRNGVIHFIYPAIESFPMDVTKGGKHDSS